MGIDYHVHCSYPAFTCSKLKMKILEQGVKYVSKVTINKLTLNIFLTLL